jgi:hypothetical protein
MLACHKNIEAQYTLVINTVQSGGTAVTFYTCEVYLIGTIYF